MDRNLIDYYPPCVKEIRENAAIVEAEQPDFEIIWNAVKNALDDQFVTTATKNGITRWENILNIIPKATEAIDTRRFRVLTRLNEQLPYTVNGLKNQLETLCGKGGFEIELLNQNYTLNVKVALVAKENFEDVKSMLNRIVPANLIIDVSIKYNQHITLADFKHSELSKYTQYDLRNEVLSHGN